MDDEAQRLGRFVEARREEMRLTQAELAERIGVSLRTVGNVERGVTVVQKARRGVWEDKLGWAPGSIRSILGGGTPVASDADDDAFLRRLMAQMDEKLTLVKQLQNSYDGQADLRAREEQLLRIGEVLNEITAISAAMAPLFGVAAAELDQAVGRNKYALAARRTTPEFSSRQDEQDERDRLAGIDPPAPEDP